MSTDSTQDDERWSMDGNHLHLMWPPTQVDSSTGRWHTTASWSWLLAPGGGSSWDSDPAWAWANPHQRRGWSAATAGHGRYQSAQRRGWSAATTWHGWYQSYLAPATDWGYSHWQDDDWGERRQERRLVLPLPTARVAGRLFEVARDLDASGLWPERTRLIIPSLVDGDDPYFEPYTDSESSAAWSHRQIYRDLYGDDVAAAQVAPQPSTWHEHPHTADALAEAEAIEALTTDSHQHTWQDYFEPDQFDSLH
jgi:hypothetical protein